MTILGIESSCDETAAAVVVDGKHMLSNVVASSLNQHAPYGGIVPEIAARSHIEAIQPVIAQALDTARYSLQDIDAIAVTRGAGLGGSLLVGVMAARTLALTHNKPLYGVNHVEGHLYANFITSTALPGYMLPGEQPQFPLLGLIVSGGHSQLVLFKNHSDYRLLGQTQDDAIGEAYDKVGKLLGLPYPGGLSVSRTGDTGNPLAYDLPKAKLANVYDFSYSGLKTAVLRLAQRLAGGDHTLPSYEIAERLNKTQIADICASFQRTAIDMIVDKTVAAFQEHRPKNVIVGGGVASDPLLRKVLAERLPIDISYTDRKLCTDNAAMIATLGFYVATSRPADDPYKLEPSPNLNM